MNRPWNANAKHIYMLHRASGMYPQYKDQNYQYGRWKDDYTNGKPKSVTLVIHCSRFFESYNNERNNANDKQI
jgi:hypothetical protein